VNFRVVLSLPEFPTGPACWVILGWFMCVRTNNMGSATCGHCKCYHIVNKISYIHCLYGHRVYVNHLNHSLLPFPLIRNEATILLLFQSHPCTVWRDVLPQNITDFSLVVLQLSSVILTCRDTSFSKFQISWSFSIVQVISSDIRKSEALRNIS
jgi:hypothetical protein